MKLCILSFARFINACFNWSGGNQKLTGHWPVASSLSWLCTPLTVFSLFHSWEELLPTICAAKKWFNFPSMLLQIWMLYKYLIFVESYQVIAIMCSSQVHIRLQIYKLHLIVMRNGLMCYVKWLRKQLEISFTFPEISTSACPYSHLTFLLLWQLDILKEQMCSNVSFTNWLLPCSLTFKSKRCCVLSIRKAMSDNHWYYNLFKCFLMHMALGYHFK